MSFLLATKNEFQLGHHSVHLSCSTPLLNLPSSLVVPLTVAMLAGFLAICIWAFSTLADDKHECTSEFHKHLITSYNV